MPHEPDTARYSAEPIVRMRGLPMAPGGGGVGRRSNTRADVGASTAPARRLMRNPRRLDSYLDNLVLLVLLGLLPFGSIFIEMYFVFTSFWAYKIYYVYGFMLLVFGILVVVTACVSIVAVYFSLNAEDYRWYAVAMASWRAPARAAVRWSKEGTGPPPRRC